MDDEKIGEICCICKRRDYIPYSCKQCQRKFCDEHYRSTDHPCLERSPRPAPLLPENSTVHRCAKCQVKLYTVTHYWCDTCKKLYCLKHRHPEEHGCQEKVRESGSNCGMCLMM